MAKVTGPLLSIGAHGNFAKTIQYSRQKGTNYVKKMNALPARETTAQKAWRDHVKYIWHSWEHLDSSEMAGMNFIAMINRVYSGLWWYTDGRHAYFFYVLQGKYSLH